MATSHRIDRKNRLIEGRSGASASSSQDYLSLATNLYGYSSICSKKYDGNVSSYTLAGIPILITTIRALLIEANSGMFDFARDEESMLRLANDPNEIGLIRDKYTAISSSTISDLELLYEVRNEIVHPAHMPSGNKHNTPNNMLSLRDRNLLQSSGDPDSDYTWISQLMSHRLYRWAFETIESTASVVIRNHHNLVLDSHCESFIECYGRYRYYDL